MTITIRDVRREDGPALAAQNMASRMLHLPWVDPFQDVTDFEAWFVGVGERRRSFVIQTNGEPAGIVELS